MSELDVMKAAREKIAEQQEEINRLTSGALQFASVVEIEPGRRYVKLSSAETSSIEVLYPRGIELKPGDGVIIMPETGQIIKKSTYTAIGKAVPVVRILSNKLCEISIAGESKVVINTQASVREGDDVIVDSSASVVLAKITGQKQSPYELLEPTNVSWDDIGGLSDAKMTLQEAVELPYQYPDLFAYYKKPAIKGVELHGPPGCGKTMLGKAVATSIATRFKGKSGFLYMKGPEILDQFVGVAESRVRKLFYQQQQHFLEKGFPGTLFIDEAESILGRRGSGISSDMEKTIVPAFLSELDGMEERKGLVILATNRPDMLDPAIIRKGRIDRAVHVRRPSVDESTAIFRIHLRKIPLAKDLTLATVARAATGELFADRRRLFEAVRQHGGKVYFTLGNLASGALIAGVVERAISNCLLDDIKRLRTRTGTGVTSEAIQKAVDDIQIELQEQDHSHDVKEFAKQVGDVIDIRKVA